jgi:lipid-binding SYLF domain-containing protein
MKMGEVGVGLGLGLKDFRVVMVFHTTESMNNFVEKGWAFGAQADAAAKASDKGAAVGGEVTIDNITIYQLTESGLALQATVKGTKYWKDENLN